MLTICNVFTQFTLVVPKEGLFFKLKNREIFCYIYFVLLHIPKFSVLVLYKKTSCKADRTAGGHS